MYSVNIHNLPGPKYTGRFTVSSVEELGVIRPTPQLLRKRKCLRQDLADFARLPPLTILTRLLVPRLDNTPKPPVMHYGWVPDIPKLMQYAKERNLLHKNPPFVDLGHADQDDSD
ncbi:hypothetical protein B0H21DRAFT_711695 [Amylocystis lapponica]|nr:hypothetical protein B0H21DRAFT_711695 [Amylocystis lapponica]